MLRFCWNTAYHHQPDADFLADVVAGAELLAREHLITHCQVLKGSCVMIEYVSTIGRVQHPGGKLEEPVLALSVV